jgi:hypothetical protein
VAKQKYEDIEEIGGMNELVQEWVNGEYDPEWFWDSIVERFVVWLYNQGYRITSK